MPARKAFVKPGHFLPTVARHIRFISGFHPDDASEIRFVVMVNGLATEFSPVSTYEVDGIVFVDLEQVEYEKEEG